MNDHPLTMLQLDVTDDDIREMYDRFNSAMCDIGTANAVSIALRKRIKPKYVPSIEFASNHCACLLRLGTEKLPLPQNLFWWLQKSINGFEVEPARFLFAIYSKLLIPKRVDFTHTPEFRVSSGEDLVPIPEA